MAIKVECEHCGARLNLKDENKVGKRIKCPKCDQPFTVTPLDEDDFEPVASPRPAKKNAKKSGGKKGKKKQQSEGSMLPLLIGGGVLLVLLIGGGAYFLLSGSGEPAVVQEQPAETVDTAAEMAMTEEAAAPVEETPAAPSPPVGIDTSWLPADSQVLIHIQPSELLASGVAGRFLETDFGKQALLKFETEYGFPLSNVSAITLGVAPDAKLLAQLPVNQFMSAPNGPGPNGQSFTPDGSYEESMRAEMEAGTSAETSSEAYIPEGYTEGMTEGMMQEGSSGASTPQVKAFGPAMTAVLHLKADFDPAQITFLAKEPTKVGDYSVYAMQETRPGAPSLMVVDQRTLVFGEVAHLQKVVERKGEHLGEAFTFLSKDAHLTLGTKLGFLSALKTELEKSKQELPPGSEQLFGMVEQGIQSAFLSCSLNDSIAINTGIDAKDAETAKQMQSQLAGLKQLAMMQFDAQAANFMPKMREEIGHTVQSLSVEQNDQQVSLAINVGPQLLDQLESQLMSAGSQMAAGFLASGGAGPGPGPNGMPLPTGGPLRKVDLVTVAAEKLNGVPAGLEAVAGAKWMNVELPPDLSEESLPTTVEVRGEMILAGAADREVVQYRTLNLTSATTADGTEIRQSQAEREPYLTAETWLPASPVNVGFQQGVSIPLQLLSPATEAVNFAGEVELRTAATVETIEVDLNDPAATAASGIRILPHSSPEAEEFFILGEEGVEVVSVQEIDGSERTRMLAQNMNSNTEFSSESFDSERMQAEMATRTETSSESFDPTSDMGGTRESRGPNGPLPPPEKPRFGVHRPGYPNPTGFVVSYPKQKAGMVRIRVARGLEETNASFAFSAVPVKIPSPEPKPEPPMNSGPNSRNTGNGRPEMTEDLPTPPAALPWLAITEELPEGVTRMDVYGNWAPPVEDETRQTLFVTIDIRGPAAAHMIQTVNLQVDDAVASDDKKLIYTPDDQGEVDARRLAGARAHVPFQTFRIQLPLAVISPSFEALKSLSGNARIHTGEGETAVVVEDFRQFDGKRILHPELSKAKIYLSLKIDDEGFTITTPKRDADKIVRMLPVDAQQRIDPSLMLPPRPSEDGKNMVYRFETDGESIRKLSLKIDIHQQIKTVQLPFNIANLPLPAPPVAE